MNDTTTTRPALDALPVVCPGDVIDTWCSACGGRTPHRVTAAGWLVCEACPETQEERDE